MRIKFVQVEILACLVLCSYLHCLNRDKLEFWAQQAQRLEWFSPWTNVLDFKCPYAHWFVNGRLNACYLCLDTHVKNGFGDVYNINNG